MTQLHFHKMTTVLYKQKLILKNQAMIQRACKTSSQINYILQTNLFKADYISQILTFYNEFLENPIYTCLRFKLQSFAKSFHIDLCSIICITLSGQSCKHFNAYDLMLKDGWTLACATGTPYLQRIRVMTRSQQGKLGSSCSDNFSGVLFTAISFQGN